MPPILDAFDHVHVFVADRDAAEVWYREVLGLQRVCELEFWARDGGPLIIQNSTGAIHLALFEREPKPCRSTIALRVSGEQYAKWKTHLAQVLPNQVSEEDHQLSISLYFSDPYGNPYEITTYEVSAFDRSN